MRFPGNTRTVAAVFLLLLVASLPHFAQTITGRILGTVHDPSGAAVANANVTVSDTQRGLTRTAATDASGNFVAASLTPGVYTVRAEAKGFKTVERQNIQVEVARDVAIDLTLSPGEVQQTIVVSGEIPMVDTISSSLGGTLSNKEINDLPLNGRNYENLLQLRPGVIRYPGGGFSTTSANGLRAEDNAYLVDGLFNSEPYSGQAIINGAGIAGDSATILPVDSIQEFNLQQNPPAEYGWKPGAVVNVGLKSGTNSVHGTAFAFGRDGNLDARNYFNTKPDPKPGRELEQFGGSVGGPIVKDKAFFFGAYERQQYNVGNSFGGITSPSMVPMPTNGTCLFVATGDCADSIPDAINDLLHAPAGSGIAVSAASLKVADCTLSGSTVTCGGKGFPLNPNPTINIPNGFNNDVHADNLVGKVDVRPNSRHSFGGMYFFGNNRGIVEDFPELQANWRSNIHTRAQVATGNWVWIPNPRWVNEARFGYNRLYQPTLPGDLNTPASTYGLNTGVSGPFTGGLPRINFGGYFFPGLGGFKWPKFQGPDTITQLVDHVSYLSGQHSVKFGAELHRNQVTNAAYGNARGGIKFLGGTYTSPSDPTLMSSQLEDFLAGAPAVASVEVGNPTVHLHNWQYSAFIQDDWRVARNLTLNFGLRYEFSSVLQEEHNLLGNFDPVKGMVQVGKQISNVYNPDHKNFAPRLGFAWDVSGTGRTVVRGGAGLTYETVNWQSFIAFNNSFGLGSVPTGAILDGVPGPGTITTGNVKVFPNVPWDNGPVYGNISPGNLSCTLDNPCSIMTVDPKLTTPYVWTWTLNVQHAFTPTLSAQLAYVGNRGTNLTGIRDINQAALGIDFSSICNTDPNCEQHSRPYGNTFDYLANIFQMGNVYRSNYNGLQATLNARNYHGLSMVAGYTYSHALDDVGANWDFGAGYGLPQDSTKAGLAKEYANSDFDIRHRLTISLTYAIPGRKGAAQMLEGWEINSIATIESAQPWGPIDLTSGIAGIGSLPVNPPQATPMRWNFYGKPSDFKSGPSGIPFFPGTSNAACVAKAAALDGGATGPANDSLAAWGCYVVRSSMMLPPPTGQFGTMGRNIFPDSGFRNLDFSIAKNWRFGERWRAQFRAEFFNVLNHPNFANPYGGQNGFGLNDPAAGGFGCGCATPDVAAANPVIGSGGSRAIQLGLKFTF
jgi:hypothetical protein